MKVGIIGGSSFIARNLVNHFSPQDSLTLWGRNRESIEIENKFNFIEYSFPEHPLRKDDLLEMDVLIYCIGAGVQPNHQASSEEIFEINAFEPIRMLNFLSKNEFAGQVITFGSYFEIGANNSIRHFNEKDLIGLLPPPLNDYCVTKRLLTNFIATYFQRSTVNLFHFILPNIYGNNENPERLLPYIVASIREGKDLEFSNGNQQRQYLHVTDVVHLIHSIVKDKCEKKGIFCLSAQETVSIKEVVRLCISEALKKGYSPKEPGFDMIKKRDEGAKYLALDSSKARKELNWQPQITLSQGIGTFFR